MAGGRKAWQPTEKDLELIKDMSSKGCTQKEICKALKVSWNTYKKNMVQDIENETENETDNEIVETPIKKAMIEGERIRRSEIMRIGEDSLLESIKVRKVIETKTVSGGNENGSFENTTITEKEVLPNPTILMFALVNATNAEEGKPIRWQSINKVEVKQENTQSNNGFKMKWTQKKSG